MRILVCGGRNFAAPIPYDHSLENKPAMDEYRFVIRKLSEIINPLSIYYNPNDNWLPNDIIIINGAAKGVDSASTDWAIVNFSQLEEYPADWKKHGKAAGIIRNKQMLDLGVDLVIAFPGGTGTADMVKKAKKAGIKVIEIDYNPS